MQTQKRIFAGHVRRRKASEAIEMVGTTAMMIILIACMLMVLTYVMECNAVNFATKRCCRVVETSGIVNESSLNNLFKSTLGSTELLQKRRLVINYTSRIGGNRIQLKDSFETIGNAVYRVHLIKPGRSGDFYIDMPIKITVHGMSEVYFRTD